MEPLEAAGRSINEPLCLTEYAPTRPAISENFSGTDAFERCPRNSLRGRRHAKLHLRNQRFNAAAILQEMSNYYCLPGRAGGPPLDVRMRTH